MENDQITTELAYQAKQTMETVEQNKKLAIENVELKRKMDLMTQIEKDLSKKSSSNLKTIKTLQSKIQCMCCLYLLSLSPLYLSPSLLTQSSHQHAITALESETSEQSNRLEREMAYLREEMAARDGKIRDLETSSTVLPLSSPLPLILSLLIIIGVNITSI